MKNVEDMEYFDTAEKLVKIICQKTQNNNPLFFRVLVSYYFAKITSMMRISIATHDRGVIPINLYAINLALSGQGKGHSTNIIEEQVIHGFKHRFLEETFPIISDKSISKIAITRSNKKQTDQDEELQKVEKEFNALGPLVFSFDSGTTAAVKQMRHKLLMSGAGSMNMEIDEIGSNLLSNMDVLTSFLELFDVGKIKQKLTKNTSDNLRNEEIDGRTPTNMMLFGTPSKLLNGSKTEDEFYTMLEAGYARRCLFGYSKNNNRNLELTPEQVYDMLTDTTDVDYIQKLSTRLTRLADVMNFKNNIGISKEVTLLLIEYKLRCERDAEQLHDHEEMKKAEISHRYFKALKLAGSYAFIEGEPDITEDILYSAIRLVEDSGEAFASLLTRERNYIKLAKYIANVGHEVTHADMVEDLPFYKGPESAKREMMTLAIAYGYKNNIVIKKIYNDGIEFLKGESLKETNLDEITISYSTELAESYKNETVPFDKLDKLTQLKGYHWTSHHFVEGYRSDNNCISGFNLLVLDVDEGTPLNTAQLLLDKYTYLMYTTKRSTDANNRYRIVMPLSHTLKLDSKDFKEFMNNIYEWIPFEVDTQTNQRSRKWSSHDGDHFYNMGEPVDALLFIPKTIKNEKRKELILDQHSLTNLERWFINNTGLGNRSNQLIRYALMLVDSGLNIDTVRNNVLALNNKLQDKMEEAEILTTILTTASKAILKRESKV